MAPELASMLDASAELLEATRPFVPHFRFVLDDLAALSPAAVSSRSIAALPRLVQLAMWASRSFPRLRDAAPFMRAVVASLTRDDRARALLDHAADVPSLGARRAHVGAPRSSPSRLIQGSSSERGSRPSRCSHWKL
jgi:hypothetical protein